MIARLVRQDPAIAHLPAGVILYSVSALFIRLTGGDLSAEIGRTALLSSRPVAIMLYCTCWLCLLFLLSPSSFWVRSGSLHLGLPLTIRATSFARTVALLSAGWIPLGILTLIVSLRFPESGFWPTPDGGILKAGLHAAGGFSLALALFYLPMPGRQRIPIGPGYLAYVGLVSAAILFVLLVTAPTLTVSGLLFLGASWVATWNLLRLPPSLSLESIRPREESLETGRQSAGPLVAISRWRLHRMVSRCLVGHWAAWIILPILGVYSGLTLRSYYEGRSPLPAVLFLGLWFWTSVLYGVKRLSQLDPLPISRRTTYVHALLPALAAMTIGIGLTQASRILHSERHDLIRRHDCCIVIPAELHEFTLRDAIPTIVSPWGESHTPDFRPLYRGAEIGLYNPYEAGEESSDRFLDLQFRRAEMKLEGGRIESDPIGPVSDSGLRSKTYAVLLTIIGLFGALMAHCLLRAQGPSPRSRLFLVCGLSYIVLIVLVLVLGILAEVFGLTEMSILDTVALVLLRSLAEKTPFSSTETWVLAILVQGALVGLVQRSFARSEAPTVRTAGSFVKEY